MRVFKRSLCSYKSNQQKFFVFGLGNFGSVYENTRHNIGFNIVDSYAKKYNARLSQTQFDSAYTELLLDNSKVVLVKPLLFMNRSGTPIKQWIDYNKCDLKKCIVVYDDIYLPLGSIKVKQNGGNGGHNGIKDIIDKLGTNKIPRLKVGIGSPPENVNLASYVLGNWKLDEQNTVNDVIARSVLCLDTWVKYGIDKAMNDFN